MQLNESEDESMEIEPEAVIQQPAQRASAQAELLTIIQQQQQQQQQLQRLLETVLNRQECAQTTANNTNTKPSLGPYDGTTDYLIYQNQFETAATKAQWTEEENYFQFSQQLRGNAAKVLGSLLRLKVPVTY